jgi:WXG100 family type VII secretion target
VADFIDEVRGIFNPGGDPDAIEAAAAACRALAADLKGVVKDLDPAAADLVSAWQGKASSGFQSAWAKFGPSVTDYAAQLDAAAARLENVAGFIRQAQQEAREFEIAMGITAAAGLALTFFTFGFSDAGAAEAEAAEAGAVATMVARLAGLLAGEAEAWGGLLSALETVAARFVLGAGMTLIATAAIKAARGLDPLDPVNWSANDATNALIGSWLLGGMGAVAGTEPVSAMLADHPILGSIGTGVVSGSLGGTIGQLWLDHHFLADLQTWEAIGASAGIAAVTGGLLGAGAKALGGGSVSADDSLAGADEPVPTGLVGPNGQPILRDTWEEQPATGAGLVGPDGQPLGGGAAGDQAPGGLVGPDGQPLAASGGSPVQLVGPDGQPLGVSGGAGQPVVAPAAGGTSAGVTYPSGLGLDSSDTIRAANRVIGGFGQYEVLYPKQQQVVGPAPQPAVRPAPTLPEPPSPPPPPVRYTVQPGDNLYTIARGNPALVQQIAEANHLANPSLIQPGQVLVIPPSPAQHYTVQPGDNLWTIAGGDPALVEQIARANHLADPAQIRPGQVLVIPPVAEPVH